jgi:2-polyprenyl-6-methoxyphenol hydroxylase-like FAD-dependent oxidoreductase
MNGTLFQDNGMTFHTSIGQAITSNDQDHSAYDVIIAGAGPVGLFLACELALARCSVLILEKEEDPHSPLKQLPFGIRGLSAPAIEAFDRRGLLEELEVHKRLKNPHKTATPQGPARQGGHFAGIPFLDGNIDASQWGHRLPSSTGINLLSEMAELESVLSRRADAVGVEIKRGFAITDFQQDENGVTVHSGGQSMRSQWLVGCDGSRSVVRKVGGFEFAGTEPEFTGYSAQVELADPEKLSAGRNLTTTGMYFQSQPGYLLMLEFDGGAAHRAEPVTLEHFQKVLRRVSNTGVTIRSLHAGTTWTDRARQATIYRKGRVLLGGDAAHIHAPLGGQGLNLGLGDAMNLGWKLAATLQQKAPEGLLDSYQTERHPLGLRVLDWSRAQVAIMKPDPPSRALNAIVRDLMNTRDGATYIAGRVWGIHTHYDLGGEHPLAGHSVPNFELEDGSTIGQLMHDGRGMLLDFYGNSLLEKWAHAYGDQLKYVSGRAKERLGLRAVLIRPDGYIAWASDSEPEEQSVRQAIDLWFGCSGEMKETV